MDIEKDNEQEEDNSSTEKNLDQKSTTGEDLPSSVRSETTEDRERHQHTTSTLGNASQSVTSISASTTSIPKIQIARASPHHISSTASEQVGNNISAKLLICVLQQGLQQNNSFKRGNSDSLLAPSHTAASTPSSLPMAIQHPSRTKSPGAQDGSNGKDAGIKDNVPNSTLDVQLLQNGTSGTTQLSPSAEIDAPTVPPSLPITSARASPSCSTVLSTSSTSRTLSAKDGNISSKTSAAGRWTTEEHQAFLRGLQLFGREWKKVATLIPTRTSAQVRSHAQKYFVKLQRDHEDDAAPGAAEAFNDANTTTSCSGSASVVAEDFGSLNLNDGSMPWSVRVQAERILAKPETVQAEVETTMELLRQRYRELQQQLRERQEQQRRQQEVLVHPNPEQPQDVVVDGDSTGESSASRVSLESLHGEELIAVHVLQIGLSARNAQEEENLGDNDVNDHEDNVDKDTDAENANEPLVKRRRLESE